MDCRALDQENRKCIEEIRGAGDDRVGKEKEVRKCVQEKPRGKSGKVWRGERERCVLGGRGKDGLTSQFGSDPSLEVQL